MRLRADFVGLAVSHERTANSESKEFAEIYRTVRDAGYSPETSLVWIRYLKKQLERRRPEREEAARREAEEQGTDRGERL